MEVMNAVDMVLKYIALPIVGFVWMLHGMVTKQQTQIEVMKAQAGSTKEAHDREFKEMRENFKRVFEKLDNIEQSLRSR
jgi:amino acid permease